METAQMFIRILDVHIFKIFIMGNTIQQWKTKAMLISSTWMQLIDIMLGKGRVSIYMKFKKVQK